MNDNIRTNQVFPVDSPGCRPSSNIADNYSNAATPPALSSIERNWSWIIVAASFWNRFVAVGIVQTLGLYNVEFLEALGNSKSTTAWITSVAGACVFGLCPLAAVIMDRSSARITACLGGIISTIGLLISVFASSVIHLLITFGVIMGSGLCMIMLSSTVIVGQYFQGRLAFVTAIASCGGALGCLLLPLYTNYIIEEYTWRGSLFLLAALSFQTVVFSSLFRPATVTNATTTESETSDKKNSITVHVTETSETSQSVQPCQGGGSDDAVTNSVSCSHKLPSFIDECGEEDGGRIPARSKGLIITLKNKVLGNLLCNMGLLLYYASGILGSTGFASLSITLPDFIYISLERKETSAFMLMCIAAGRIGGAMVASLLGNWKPAYCLHMHCVSFVLMGIAAILYTCSTNVYAFGILSCTFGVGSGAIVAWLTQITVNLVGTKNLAQTVGYGFAAGALGRLTGPPLGGFLFDISGDYRASFWLTFGFMLSGGLLPVILLLKQRCGKQYDVTKSESPGGEINTSPLARD